jgi:uncharacterized protein with PIN domain
VGRIRKAYETRFRWLLQQVRARRLDQGVKWLIARASRLSAVRREPMAVALDRVYHDLAARPAFQVSPRQTGEPHFFCDSGLGGLARWLRASGYEAEWEPRIDDDVLLQRASASTATILTTDSMLMERRLLRDRIIPAYWLPPVLTIREQLRRVFQEFGLKRKPPRCTACGGELLPRDKETLRDQIPPRTFRWLDDYFVCSRCGKLFWHGTHWGRVLNVLNQLDSEPPCNL